MPSARNVFFKPKHCNACITLKIFIFIRTLRKGKDIKIADIGIKSYSRLPEKYLYFFAKLRKCVDDLISKPHYVPLNRYRSKNQHTGLVIILSKVSLRVTMKHKYRHQ